MNRHFRRWNRCGGGRRDDERCCGRRGNMTEGKAENTEQSQAPQGEKCEQQHHEGEAGRNSPTEDYLKYVGSSVAALLDPLGMYTKLAGVMVFSLQYCTLILNETCILAPSLA